jgi:hypothetical protein
MPAAYSGDARVEDNLTAVAAGATVTLALVIERFVRAAGRQQPGPDGRISTDLASPAEARSRSVYGPPGNRKTEVDMAAAGNRQGLSGLYGEENGHDASTPTGPLRGVAQAAALTSPRVNLSGPTPRLPAASTPAPSAPVRGVAR